MTLQNYNWLPQTSQNRIEDVMGALALSDAGAVMARLDHLAQASRDIHEKECFNLNPATNVMNPKAEALLSTGLGTRPSLGYPGDKYEMGLEAIEEIEIIAAALASEVFEARFAEVRVASGAMANLYTFMALCQPGDTIIAPPAQIGGHVTHHAGGCAGLYGLRTVEAPVHADGYTVDIDALRQLAHKERPKLITIGGSLNLFEHPVEEVRHIADEVGAYVLFDAAHQCGIIAGKAWKNPLHHGAHVMSMSTYKSLGGPAGGILVTNDAEIAQRLDQIAFPGMTANFDVAKTAALAVTLLDWRSFGQDYAAQMVRTSQALAQELMALGIEVFAQERGATHSHQFALCAAPFGGGQTASRLLRQNGFLACGIGLPIAPVSGDLNGLRFGTPELVRFGMTPDHMPRLAALIAEALNAKPVRQEVSNWRQTFSKIHFIHE